MKTVKNIPTTLSTSRLSRAIEGSSAAVIKGWLWGAAPFTICCLIGYPIALACMLPYVLLAWLLVCLPLYCYEEYRPLFKDRALCAFCGVLGGPLLLYALPWAVGTWIPEARGLLTDETMKNFHLYGIIPAMITGGVACSEASRNRDEFMYEDRETEIIEGYEMLGQSQRLNFSLAPTNTTQMNDVQRS
jgi:hypothetical protein